MRRKINIVTLGCAKNIVDSEQVMGQLEKHGYSVNHDGPVDSAPVAVINTCGFIRDAKQESIDTILNFIEAKQEGRISEVFVMGCLSERYRDELADEIPEVDGYFGARDIRDVLTRLLGREKIELTGERHLTTPSHYAYIKISEGCSRQCSFCAIPGIRGPHLSRPKEEIISEARGLINKGVKELILIAQDTTWYGVDLYKRRALPELVEELARLDGIRWIRIHYAYPESFPMDLLRVMRENPKVCRYLDIPVQHISDRILQSMKRGGSSRSIRELLAEIRRLVPGIALRTSLIVGYPGETEDEFRELIRFVEEARFERLGVFAYSHEENTPAFDLKDDVPEDVKQERVDRLMAVQQDISLDYNQNLEGSQLEVLIDRLEGTTYIGRTQSDSPEIDNEVLIETESHSLKPGDFTAVRVLEAREFDLICESL